MGYGIFSGNTTIKTNAAVNVSNTATTSAFVTVYTAPANGFAILNVRWEIGTTNVSIRVGASGLITGTQTVSSFTTGIYVGSGNSLQVNNPAGTGTATCYASGSEYLNTP